MDRPILVPQHQQVDAGSLELPHQRRPVGLGMQARPSTHTGVDEQPCHQALVGDIRSQWPDDPRCRSPAQILAHRAWCDAELPPNRSRARPRAEMHHQQLPYTPHGQPLRRHPTPPSIAMAALDARSLLTHETILFPDAPTPRSGRHRQNDGRLEIGMVGAIRSERWAASDRYTRAAYVRIRTCVVSSLMLANARTAIDGFPDEMAGGADWVVGAGTTSL